MNFSRFSVNTVEIIVTDTATATSGSLSPCGRGPGRGGQGSTNRLVRGRGQASSPLSLPSPARGEGELTTGRLLGYDFFNGIGFRVAVIAGALLGLFSPLAGSARAQQEQAVARGVEFLRARRQSAGRRDAP